MKKFFVLLTVAALFVACGDESSSSAPASDLSEKSSSSIEMTNESSSSTTVKNSSSSVSGDKSSSSVKKEDSSSSAVKESSSSAMPKSSCSEEVKQSSSSIVASSSSVDIVKSSSSGIVFDTVRFCTPGYSYCDRSLGADSVQAGAYKKFTDTRNGRTYYYLTINGVDKNKKPASVTVMAENLNIGEMVDGEDDQENDAKIERYCYDNDTTNCDKYGGLYQWAEMMQLPSECNTKSCADLIKPNHQGICPDSWRLLTEDDFYIILHADGNDVGAKGVRANSFAGLNYSGYSLIGTGYNWNHEFKRLGESSYWFYPEEEAEDSEMGALAGYQTKSLTSNGSQYTYKTNGFSVRCVKVE
ncbi:MAG: hypothetical protein IJ905_08530 [Fibrobacter sp.]|nr:hypothetical protein [Fibrobacter sp.]